MDHVFKKGL